MTITVQKCEDYTNPLNCGIAKALRRKGIFSLVGPSSYHGLFLGIIPVWGTIPYESNKVAHRSDELNFVPTKVRVGLYDRKKK